MTSPSVAVEMENVPPSRDSEEQRTKVEEETKEQSHGGFLVSFRLNCMCLFTVHTNRVSLTENFRIRTTP